MKKTICLIAILTISLIGTAWGQERRRAPRKFNSSTALGGGSGVGIKNRKPMNLGDTATHEVGHWVGRKGKRQALEVENDETHRTRSRAGRTETVDNNETLRKPKQGNAQNLLPYMEQSNKRKSHRRN